MGIWNPTTENTSDQWQTNGIRQLTGEAGGGNLLRLIVIINRSSAVSQLTFLCNGGAGKSQEKNALTQMWYDRQCLYRVPLFVSKKKTNKKTAFAVGWE